MHSTFLSAFAFAALLIPTQALYFYIDGPTQKCFFEELPKDTLVVGMLQLYFSTTTSIRPNYNVTIHRNLFYSHSQLLNTSMSIPPNHNISTLFTINSH